MGIPKALFVDIFTSVDVLSMRRIESRKVEVIARNDLGLTVCAGVADLRRCQVDIIQGLQAKFTPVVLHIDTRRAVEISIRIVAHEGAADINVAPGNRHQTVATLQGAAEVVDVGASIDIDLIPADKTTVVERIGINLRHFPAKNFAAVG